MPFKDAQKQKEYKHKWYLENKERILKERKIRYGQLSKEERYPESRKEYFRKRYIENREQIKERNEEWRKENPEKCAAYVRRSYHENPEPAKERHRKWMKANPEKNRLYHFRRRVLHGDKVEIETLNRVCEDNIKEYGVSTCIYCKKTLKEKEIVLDHLTPVSRGGTNDYENLKVSCRSCNARKHNKTYEEFLVYQMNNPMEPLVSYENPVCV